MILPMLAGILCFVESRRATLPAKQWRWAILGAVAMMAEDPSLTAQVRELIQAGKTGERAVFEAFAGFQATLEALGGRFAERATDLGTRRSDIDVGDAAI